MENRQEQGTTICKTAGELALRHFKALGGLAVERKGHHDLVSQADRDVETMIREALARSFPEDGIVGEEHAPVASRSGWTWIIDPIDGTSNFLNGRPHWCVVLAAVKDNRVEIGVIYDPVHDDLYVARRGKGATLNGAPMQIADAKSFKDGAMGIGHSRYSVQGTVGQLVNCITEAGGTITAYGSGALSIAYVAAGRTIGHAEGFMRAWDCLAALLMVEEAGGTTEGLNPQDVIDKGTRIIVSAPTIFDDLVALADPIFTQA